MPVWEEPARGGFAAGLVDRPGLERVRALMAPGSVQPPLFRLSGMRVVQAGPGATTLSLPASRLLADPLHLVDIFMVAEAAATLAGMAGAGPGRDVRCAAISFHHQGVATLDAERIIARATTVHAGRTYTLTEVVLEDAVGRAIGRAIASLVGVDALAGDHPPGSEEPSWPSPDPWRRDFPLPPTSDLLAEQDRLAADPSAAIQQAPLHAELGLRAVEVTAERNVNRSPRSGWRSDRPSRIAAGSIASFTGWTMAGATAIPTDHQISVIEHHVQFLRPVAPDDGPLLCHARMTHDDGALRLTAGEVTDAEGRVVAVAGFTSISRPPRVGSAPPAERKVATILFTDLVGSTDHARDLGDEVWRHRLATHNAVVRRQLDAFRGREMKTTGDGFLVLFDSPARAVQCAKAIRSALQDEGMEVRIGLHAGECDLSAGDVTGLAVHVAARIEAQAGAGEVLVSQTVRDLAAGSGLLFHDAGEHTLKGIDGTWRLSSVPA